MSPPLMLDEAGLEWQSAFARKMVLADFGKTFFDSLKAARSDLLIVDFICERYDVMRSESSYITVSWDLADAGFDPFRHPTRRFENVERLRAETHALWHDACRRFAREFRERFPWLPVVLHKARGLRRYRNERGEVVPFPPQRERYIAAVNTMLESYDAAFQRELPNVRTIEFPETYCADAAHRWGVAPYHYEDGYYIDAMRALERIADDVAPSSGRTLPRRRVPSEESRPGGSPRGAETAGIATPARPAAGSLTTKSGPPWTSPRSGPTAVT